MESDRLVLREMEEVDAPFIHRLMNDPAWLRYIGDKGIRTVEDAQKYITTGAREMYARYGFGLLAGRVQGHPGPRSESVA